MSRDISTLNQAEIDAAHLHEVILVKFEFDTPVYVHSGIGTISYGGNDYTGVGDLGAISGAKESERLGPAPIQLSLTGIDSSLLTEALDAGNYKDAITIYVGYRQDDGTLVDDPWIAWKGFYEYASISKGDENFISITAQHDLMVLNEKDGSRFSDEDQNERYATDTFFTYITENATNKLPWAIPTRATGSGTVDPFYHGNPEDENAPVYDDDDAGYG